MTKVAEVFQSMDYGPAPEEAAFVHDWLNAHDTSFGHFINGEFVATTDKLSSFDSINPATGERLASLATAGKKDVDAAMSAARAAYQDWSSRAGHERARFIYALARLIQKNSRFLAILETLDNGKPIRESRDLDIPLAARHFYHHAGWAQLMESEFPDHVSLGVAAQVIPWNFPFLMLAWKIAPAIAAGNCVVLKPAEYTSLTALYFGELCLEAGLPPGVVNIVTGAGETGELVVSHAEADKVAFTGSTEVGRLIRRQTAGTGKKLSLELGGKSPFIIFEDADIDGAVEGLVDAIWFNQGQVCCAGSRLLVEESISEQVFAKIKHRLGRFRVGDPLDKAVDMGAIVDPSQKARISELVAQSASEGAEVWTPDIEVPETGCFYPPTLISNVGTNNTAIQEEIFGPVLAAMTFRTLGEASALANNSRYGLAATIWSENINKALEISAEVKAGIVWINTTNAFDAACGFGGFRESGFGREGGREGFYEYLKPKEGWQATSPLVATLDAEADTKEEPTGFVDQTPKNYIGGKQKRPDGGQTRKVFDAKGQIVGRVGLGNRKDIRDAVEAAFKSPGWATKTGHARAQILYFVAENLSSRSDEFVVRLQKLTGQSKAKASAEVSATIARLFSYGAWADKYDGLVHSPPQRNVVLAVNEPIGVFGLVCPDVMPLLSFVSLWAPVVAMGNRAVIVPSERYPLIATDMYQVLETSDVPAGVINIVTGERDVLTKTLAEHNQVDAVWYHGTKEGSHLVEASAASNIKRTWVNHGQGRNWLDASHCEGREFLRHATEVKNIWLPYGD